MKHFVLTAAVISVGMALAPSAAHAAPADTLVDFNIIEYDGILDETFYRGEIFSDRRKCLVNRKIVIFRKQAGKDEKIAKGEANEDKPDEFGWSASTDGQASSGTYYAKAPAIRGCEADKSDTLKY
jgi:hypothetical protein